MYLVFIEIKTVINTELLFYLSTEEESVYWAVRS
jgi:hypothetical protein